MPAERFRVLKVSFIKKQWKIHKKKMEIVKKKKRRKHYQKIS